LTWPPATQTQALDSAADISEVKDSEIRVLLVDYHVMVRTGFRRIINGLAALKAMTSAEDQDEHKEIDELGLYLSVY